MNAVSKCTINRHQGISLAFLFFSTCSKIIHSQNFSAHASFLKDVFRITTQRFFLIISIIFLLLSQLFGRSTVRPSSDILRNTNSNL